MKFNHYLDAYLFCLKSGIRNYQTAIKHVNNQYYMVEPVDAEMGNL